VQISSNIRRSYHRVRRAYGALRARLRRTHVGVALLAMLMLTIGEPLLCVIHCQVWIPFAHQNYSTAQHAHMHHHMPGMIMLAEAAPAGAAAVASPVPESAPGCFMLRAGGNHGDVPFHVPPSPIHDLMPTLGLLSLLVLLASIYLPAATRDPPNAPRPLHLRPPIPFAV